jgi:hypothetical protein
MAACMATLMEHVGIRRQINLVKIDIEEGEWDVISPSQDTHWLQFVDQLIIRLYSKKTEKATTGRTPDGNDIFNLFEELEKKLLYPFHSKIIYKSAFCPVKSFCVEYSFLRVPAIPHPTRIGDGDFEANQYTMVPTEIVTKRKLHAIAVLMRVYVTSKEYDGLINRTKNLLTRKWAVDNYDFVMFHEPALPLEHRQYILDGIKSMKSNINVVFEDVSNLINSGLEKMNVSNEALCPSNDISRSYDIGYKGMCYFWYGGFIHTDAAKRYKTFFRVDEDVLIRKELPGFYPYSEVTWRR